MFSGCAVGVQWVCSGCGELDHGEAQEEVASKLVGQHGLKGRHQRHEREEEEQVQQQHSLVGLGVGVRVGLGLGLGF